MNGSRKPPSGMPSWPCRKAMTEAGRSWRGGLGEQVGAADARRDHPDREVADHLAARRHLDRTAQQDVRVVVGLDHLGEPVADPEGVGLRAQVRQLAAGNLVAVDARGGRALPGLERRVEVAHRLPVRLEGGRVGEVEPAAGAGVALGVGQGGEQGAEAGLAAAGGERRGGAVDPVDPGVDGGEVGGQLPAGGVVGVQAHGQVEARAQRRDERGGRGRAQQPGHVLDHQHVRAGVHVLLGHAQVVVEGVGAPRPGRGRRRCSRWRPRRSPRARARRRSPDGSARRC